VTSVEVEAAHAAGPRPLFQLPFPCGERWQLQTYPGHDDYDIDMFPLEGAAAGRPIIASFGGTVAFAGWDRGGGWMVKLNHGGGWETLYLHMQSAPAVSTGQGVSQRQVLGRVGSTGEDVTAAHLHYEQVRDGAKVESWFNGVRSRITTDGFPDGEPGSGPTIRVSANCEPEEEPRPFVPDVTGDGYADLLGRQANGTMWLFSNNFVRDAGRPYNDVRQIGSGWGQYTRLVGADATGDGYTDIIGVKADGTMWLFSNNFIRDAGRPYNDVRQIGSGWSLYERIL
jgi:hypothetical protein